MKHILMTGGSGQLGRFLTSRLEQDGHRLIHLGRTPPADDNENFVRWDLSSTGYSLPSADVLIHCALSHEPGKYRGGEGDDPHGFIRLNVDGTQCLFEAAKAAGVRHVVFLSSRAVYSCVEDWAVLKETSETEPGTLYGQVKLAGEQALEMLCDQTMSGTGLRITGVYGCPPNTRTHKWADLLDAFERGEQIAPRVATELHGDDLASAVALILEQDPADRPNFDILNVSDLLLDRQDLLRAFAEAKGLSVPVCTRAFGPLGVMDAGKLKALGWVPGGTEKLQNFLRAL